MNSGSVLVDQNLREIELVGDLETKPFNNSYVFCYFLWYRYFYQ